MARVVTVTSMALQRDSRTLKFAASVARLGHDSVVVEGEPSTMLGDDLPFELISPPGLPLGSTSRQAAVTDQRDVPATPLASRVGAKLPAGLRSLVGSMLGPPVNWLQIVAFNARDYLGRNRETWRLLPEADVYWLHSFWQFPSVYLKARRMRARFLYDTPDAYWEEEDPTLGRPSRSVLRAYEKIERFCARRAERLTTVSNGVASLIERRFGRRPELIKNFHDTRLDTGSAEDIRAASGVTHDDFLLVVVGNMKPELMVEEALLAMHELPDRVHMSFVGRNHEPNLGRIAELGLADRVHVLGHRAPTKIVGFIGGADAAPILTRGTTGNDRFALPNKFFHSVSAGLPLLYPSLPEMQALAEEHDLGIEIDPADPGSIAAGVRALTEDAEALDRYRASAERAREAMSWEREEPVLAEILG